MTIIHANTNATPELISNRILRLARQLWLPEKPLTREDLLRISEQLDQVEQQMGMLNNLQ